MNKIKKITRKKLEKNVAVYDITVPETESFLANNILVHNCSEIFLSSGEDESFVCDLSSLNLERWDEIVETDAVETLVYFLDAVMSEFILKVSSNPDSFMSAPLKFAINQRALGVGVLGWHSYLQSKMIAFESMDAKFANGNIWSTIRGRADAATAELAKLFGEPFMLKGYGRRNSTTLAVAPTTSCVTPETLFLDGEYKEIDYYTFCHRGGLDLNKIMQIEIEYEDGSIAFVNYDEEIEVDGKNIQAYKLL